MGAVVLLGLSTAEVIDLGQSEHEVRLRIAHGLVVQLGLGLVGRVGVQVGEVPLPQRLQGARRQLVAADGAARQAAFRPDPCVRSTRMVAQPGRAARITMTDNAPSRAVRYEPTATIVLPTSATPVTLRFARRIPGSPAA